MIRPAPDRDWFQADTLTAARVSAVPGWRRPTWGLPQLHRTHLPLIVTDEAARFCTPPPIDLGARARHDEQTRAHGYVLRTHQHAAVEFARQRRGVLIADEPRVGKTLAAIATHEPTLGSLVVIAPLMVRETWLRWLRKVFPGEDIGIMLGKTFERTEATKPIVFGHYAVLRHWGRDFPIGTLILDEAHELSNPRTHRTIGAAMLASRAQRVLALTGTPIWNRPIGLWSILSLIAPGAFGSYEAFGWRYCDPQPTAYGTEFKGSTRGDELDARLSQIRIRRRHADIQAELPPITRDVIVADVSDAQRRKLDLLAEGLRKSERTNTAGQLARYRAVLGEIKVGVTLDRARQILMQEPVVIWTWHRPLAARLHREFVAADVPAFLISGDVSAAKREERLAAWHAHPAAALVITIPTGQVGIDLSHAKQALFVEIDYTPALVEQAEKRTYAPTRPSHVTYVIADHVSDRRVIEALISKLAASQPLGLTAAEEAIDLFSALFGRPAVEADMDRLMAALIAYDEEQAGAAT